MPRRKLCAILVVAVGWVVSSAAAEKVYWLAGSTKIKRANLDGSNVETVVDLGSVSSSSFALDPHGGKAYWTMWDTPNQMYGIQRADLNGLGIETLYLAPSGEIPHGLTLELAERKLYWTTAPIGSSWVHRANMDGSDVEYLGNYNGLATTALGLYREIGKLYAGGNQHTAPLFQINVAPPVGITTLIPNVGFVEAVAIDKGAAKLYYATLMASMDGAKGVWRANLDGSGLERLETWGARGVALDLAAGKYYFIEWDTDHIRRRSIAGGPSQIVVAHDGDARVLALCLAKYGDISPPEGNGVLDVDDISELLAGFINPPEHPLADIWPCGGNSVIDVDDILEGLAAFMGQFSCPHPCP